MITFTMELSSALNPSETFTVIVTIPDQESDQIKVEADDDLTDLSARLTDIQRKEVLQEALFRWYDSGRE